LSKRPPNKTTLLRAASLAIACKTRGVGELTGVSRVQFGAGFMHVISGRHALPLHACSVGQAVAGSQILEMERMGERLDAKRACGNTSKVPHQIEGNFLTVGDMYAKLGDEPRALQAYLLEAEFQSKKSGLQLPQTIFDGCWAQQR
jgi:hypothetical protein